MHTDKNEYFDTQEEESSVQLKQMLSKYLGYWPCQKNKIYVNCIKPFRH